VAEVRPSGRGRAGAAGSAALTQLDPAPLATDGASPSLEMSRDCRKQRGAGSGLSDFRRSTPKRWRAKAHSGLARASTRLSRSGAAHAVSTLHGHLSAPFAQNAPSFVRLGRSRCGAVVATPGQRVDELRGELGEIMNPSTLGRAVPFLVWVSTPFAAMFPMACSPTLSGEDDVGVARIALSQAPTDVRCLEITAQGIREVVKRFDIIPATNATFELAGLPLGDVQFNGNAFQDACADSSPASMPPPTWVADPVAATIVKGVVAQVALIMRRSGRASISVDFSDDGPKINSFTASPITVNAGDPSTLGWTTTNATSCSIDSGIGTVNCNGSSTVSPTSTTTYTLTATAAGGESVTATATVAVTYCHAIIAVKGGGVDTPGVLVACPTGMTQFCEPVPLNPTDNSQAGDACTACFGPSRCTNEFGLFWFGTSSSDPSVNTSFFNQTAGNGHCAGRPGDITNGWDCPQSRWAPGP
jgi:hypothetical protein